MGIQADGSACPALSGVVVRQNLPGAGALCGDGRGRQEKRSDTEDTNPQEPMLHFRLHFRNSSEMIKTGPDCETTL
jgi:hypothetical protein